MLAKMSVDQVLMKARTHAKKDEIVEAQKLYQAVLIAFPKNVRAQQGLATLKNSKRKIAIHTPPQETIDNLVKMYNQGQFSVTVNQAHSLTEQFPDVFIIWNILGASAIQIGMLDKAIEAYKKCIILKPNYADAYINLGFALKDQGKTEEAIEAYKKCISIKPDYAVAYSNMGNALKDQGKLDKAIEAYKKCISLKPDYAIAYSNMGNALKDQGKLEEAIESYKNALSIKPDYAEAYSNMGVVLRDQGKLEKAIEAYKNALSIKPNYAEAYNNMGITLKDQSKLDEAIETYKKCISLKPDYAEAYSNMGIVLQDQGKLKVAIEAYKKVLLLNPTNAEAYSYMGAALKDLGKFDEAIEAFKKSISLKPNYADAYMNMGNAFKDQGKLDKAIEAYKKAISIKPDYAEAHQNLSFTLLNNGRLKEGFDEYEWRWKTDKHLSHQRYFSQPMWDGEKSLEGKRILLWCEQGIGDTINWSSCLSFISSQAEHCILECQEKLVPLLERSFPDVEVKAENRSLDSKRDNIDFHLPMGSLYKQFIQEISQNAKVDPYLVPHPVRVNFWKERLSSLGDGPYIGISWKSSNMSPNRLPNYTPISEWSPLLRVPDVTFINLQYLDFVGDLTKIRDELGVTVHNFDDLDHYNNVDDVAALCRALDIVVSNKITVPLISAGVGTLTKLVNWRQSPWNNVLLNPISSSVDIFERDTWESWNKVFCLIAEDVLKMKNKTNDQKGIF